MSLGPSGFPDLPAFGPIHSGCELPEVTVFASNSYPCSNYLGISPHMLPVPQPWTLSPELPAWRIVVAHLMRNAICEAWNTVQDGRGRHLKVPWLRQHHKTDGLPRQFHMHCKTGTSLRIQQSDKVAGGQLLKSEKIIQLHGVAVFFLSVSTWRCSVNQGGCAG